MYPYRRTIIIFIKGLLSPKKQRLTDESILSFRVLPQDLDTNLHMNNGRFLTLMDLGRYDMIARSGILKVVLKKRWMPVVASAHILFKKSLMPWEKFTLRTRVVYWDEKWFYIEQKFLRGDKLVGLGVIKGCFKTKRGLVQPSDIPASVGDSPNSPPRPNYIDYFEKLDDLWLKQTTEGAST